MWAIVLMFMTLCPSLCRSLFYPMLKQHTVLDLKTLPDVSLIPPAHLRAAHIRVPKSQRLVSASGTAVTTLTPTSKCCWFTHLLSLSTSVCSSDGIPSDSAYRGASQSSFRSSRGLFSGFPGKQYRREMHSTQYGDGQGGEGMTLFPTAEHKYTIIWMHGLGDTAAGWTFLPSALASHSFSKNTKYMFLTAGNRPISINAGFSMPAWADIYGISENAVEDFEGYNKSMERVHKLIDAEIKQTGIPSDHIVIGGFSQGAALAYMAALQYPANVGAIVVLSGWLPVRHQLFVNNKTFDKTIPVIQLHGEEDVIVPVELAKRTVEKLKELTKLQIQFGIVPHMGHTTSPDCLEKVGKFINQVIAAKS